MMYQNIVIFLLGACCTAFLFSATYVLYGDKIRQSMYLAKLPKRREEGFPFQKHDVTYRDGDNT